VASVLRNGSMKVGLGAVALLLVTVLDGPARAQEHKDEMLEQWRQGSVEYTLGHYDAAVAHYEQGYRLFEEPALLYNLAQAYRKTGAIEQAVMAYHSYLLRSPPNAPNRELARKRIAELEVAVAARKAAAGAAAAGAGPAATGLGAPRAVPTTTLAVAEPPSAVEAPLAAVDLRAPAPEEAPVAGAAHRRWWLWGLAAVVVAGGVTAILLATNRTPDTVQGSAGSATIP
jgi:tetratricopeptide (TPR) repeat protein